MNDYEQLKEFFNLDKNFKLYNHNRKQTYKDLKKECFTLKKDEETGRLSLEVSAPHYTSKISRIKNFIINCDFLTFAAGDNIIQIKAYDPE